MAFENLTIGRIIIHEIFRLNGDRTMADPHYGNMLIQLDTEAKDALQKRITEAQALVDEAERVLFYLREQITTMEVGMARVYNYAVALKAKTE